MITKEDKQKQELARIETALKKKDFARRFLEQAEQEIRDAMRMLEEEEKPDCQADKMPPSAARRYGIAMGRYEEAKESNG